MSQPPPGSPRPSLGEIQVNVSRSMISESKLGVEVAVATLQKLLGNIAANPSEEKFRSIKLTNAKISAKICTCSGAVKMLTACGFKESGRVLTLEGAPDLALLAFALQRLSSILDDAAAVECDGKAALLQARAAQSAKEKETAYQMQRTLSGDKKERKQEGWTAQSQMDRVTANPTRFNDIGVKLDGDDV